VLKKKKVHQRNLIKKILWKKELKKKKLNNGNCRNKQKDLLKMKLKNVLKQQNYNKHVLKKKCREKNKNKRFKNTNN